MTKKSIWLSQHAVSSTEANSAIGWLEHTQTLSFPCQQLNSWVEGVGLIMQRTEFSLWQSSGLHAHGGGIETPGYHGDDDGALEH
ncbi:uncharacterized protein N7511_006395 [Penicillium nucicola]|uniref:uncharacterized protein n=1 Tax=Penicillium nucicola TaxID=1850975 RepID=UPI002545A4A4|nr:uncharacterized protein N7511_006395 [Penicillium nucicola]KAJ5757701.1 hypothetical protein N7511_006395 [Penicillium nucicola]